MRLLLLEIILLIQALTLNAKKFSTEDSTQFPIVYKGAIKDSSSIVSDTLKRSVSQRNFLGIAPMGLLFKRQRIQYERVFKKSGLGGIMTQYNGTWRGQKIEPFIRIYLNSPFHSKNKLFLYAHLQLGAGLLRIPYTKITSTQTGNDFTVVAEFPNYEIKSKALAYGSGYGGGLKFVDRKNFFFDLCVRVQHYNLANKKVVETKDGDTTTQYVPSRANGFFSLTGPGAEFVASFVIGYKL